VPLPEQLSSTPLLVRKSDGATLYATRDLAAIRFYVREFAPDLVLQCVGAEQSLHFRQVYYAAKAAGYMGETQFVHVANGLVRLPEGKMSTRKGRTIRLEDLLDEAAAKMTQILDEKGCEVMGAERATLVEQLAVGAVKFADLGRDRTGDITFTWEAALSFDGYAAPYLMYTHARARSVLRKAEVAAKLPVPQSFAPAERALVLGLLRYPLVLAEAAAGFAPHVLAQYLFGLAQSFNAFYQSLPILNAESPAEREARLYLVQRSSEVLAAGLGVLGVGAPERM
jgi:arginyl-tRNA synthetase